MRKRILITGKNGLIGSNLDKKFEEQDKYIIEVTGRKELDITKQEDFHKYLKNNTYDYLIHTSGIKEIEVLEKDYNLAYKTNIMPIENIVKVIKKSQLKTKIIFLSSDYVFSNDNGKIHRENDKHNPKTNYGKSKSEAEKILMKSETDYKIIRTQSVMGLKKGFLKWLIEEIQLGKEIELYDNLYFNPTFVEFFCDCMIKIIEKYDQINEKILHVIGGKTYSKYEFGNYVKKYYKNSKSKIIAKRAPKETKIQNPKIVQSEYIKKLETKSHIEQYINKIKENSLEI